MIDRYIPDWNWEILSANEAITWTGRLMEKYKEFFSEYCHEHGVGEVFINKKRNPFACLSVNNEIKTSYTREEFNKVINTESFRVPSFDERLPWSGGLIAKYLNSWDWEVLSTNPSLHWSVILIDRFIDRWDFGGVKEHANGDKYNSTGLSFNVGLPWSLALIKKYESKWD